MHVVWELWSEVQAFDFPADEERAVISAARIAAMAAGGLAGVMLAGPVT